MNKNQDQPEENELADWFQEKYEAWRPYLPVVLSVVGIVAVAAIGGAWWFQNKKNEEARVWRELANTRSRFFSLQQESATGKMSTQVLRDFADLYDGTPAGDWARFEAAQWELRNGLARLQSFRNTQFDPETGQPLSSDKNGFQVAVEESTESFENADRLLDSVLANESELEPLLVNRVVLAKAVVRESLGDFSGALKHFERIVELGQDDPLYSIAVRGVKRCNDPGLAEFYESFVAFEPKLGDAPGTARLPEIPNIDFPTDDMTSGDFLGNGGAFQGDGGPDGSNDGQSDEAGNAPPVLDDSADDDQSDDGKADDGKSDDGKSDDGKSDDGNSDDGN